MLENISQIKPARWTRPLRLHFRIIFLSVTENRSFCLRVAHNPLAFYTPKRLRLTNFVVWILLLIKKKVVCILQLFSFSQSLYSVLQKSQSSFKRYVTILE